ncbi:MAG: tryptophan synthase subunit alpha [Chitinophagaceae bacterium]
MNRVDILFQKKSKNILSVYFPAGFPNLNDTFPILTALQENGIDMVEIGIPFSDPIADGVVIQQASSQALKNGMSVRLLFKQLKKVRSTIHIPLLFMGYFNPILQYGFDLFCHDCKEIGIDGMIIPDLPFEIYQKKYQSIIEKYNLKMVMLITPETSEERIQLIDKNTNGFIYMVSSASTTGTQQIFDDKKKQYFSFINNMNLKNRLMIGFGVSNKATYSVATQYANGAIIGSKLVQLLGQEKNVDKAIKALKESII